MVRYFSLLYLKIDLKGHSQLWDRADLDTSFASLKSVYLNLKLNVRVRYIKKSAQSCLLFYSILDLLLKTSFFYSSFYNILSYLIKNSIQRNMNTRRRRARGIAFVYQNNKRNESNTLASKQSFYVFGKSM